MPLPELTPEQLEQLNAISGLGKTRKRKDAPSGDNLPDVAPADLCLLYTSPSPRDA